MYKRKKKNKKIYTQTQIMSTPCLTRQNAFIVEENEYNLALDLVNLNTIVANNTITKHLLIVLYNM
jgi:hypothetical protein